MNQESEANEVQAGVLNDESYTDEKGRVRWRRNDEIAEKLVQLHTFLIIADYPESHAARYPRLAHAISRHPESIEKLFNEGRLEEEIAGVGETIATIIGQYLTTGTSAKLEEFVGDTPRTIAELVPIPGIGAKTIKRLYEELGIDSLAALNAAIEAGRLKGFKGIGKKTLEKIRQYIGENLD
jgi:DNA polymerase (family X)